MNVYSAKQFGALLDQTGDALNKDATNGNPLRQLADAIRPFQYTATDQSSRFVVYFLCAFTEDFFYNLAGDIPFYQDVTECQHRVLTDVGKKLKELARAAEGNQLAGSQRILEAMVSEYLKSISQLNGKS